MPKEVSQRTQFRLLDVFVWVTLASVVLSVLRFYIGGLDDVALRRTSWMCFSIWFVTIFLVYFANMARCIYLESRCGTRYFCVNGPREYKYRNNAFTLVSAANGYASIVVALQIAEPSRFLLVAAIASFAAGTQIGLALTLNNLRYDVVEFRQRGILVGGSRIRYDEVQIVNNESKKQVQIKRVGVIDLTESQMATLDRHLHGIEA